MAEQELPHAENRQPHPIKEGFSNLLRKIIPGRRRGDEPQRVSTDQESTDQAPIHPDIERMFAFHDRLDEIPYEKRLGTVTPWTIQHTATGEMTGIIACPPNMNRLVGNTFSFNTPIDQRGIKRERNTIVDIISDPDKREKVKQTLLDVFPTLEDMTLDGLQKPEVIRRLMKAQLFFTSTYDKSDRRGLCLLNVIDKLPMEEVDHLLSRIKTDDIPEALVSQREVRRLHDMSDEGVVGEKNPETGISIAISPAQERLIELWRDSGFQMSVDGVFAKIEEEYPAEKEPVSFLYMPGYDYKKDGWVAMEE